jgi:hypothetical protein
MADLTVGVLGVLCSWLRGNFWLATAIANAVWLLGDAIDHISPTITPETTPGSSSSPKSSLHSSYFFLALYDHNVMMAEAHR